MDNQTGPGAVKTISPSRREIDLEIPWERVRAERDRAVEAFAGRVKLAGFRQGKAPRDMVRRLYDEEIRHEVVDHLVPEVLEENLKDTGLRPVNVPVIEDLSFSEDQPLRCRVSFEVLPDFPLPDWRSITVDAKPAVVEDPDVDHALEDLRNRGAQYVPVEGRGVAEHDYAVVEIQGRDKATKKLLPVEKSVILVGRPDNEPALEEAVKGLKPGEERHFDAAYPKEHPNRKVAGRDIAYRVKVLELKERKLPDLDDAFAKSLGDYADLDDLKAKLRAGLETSKESARRNAVASDILKELAVKAEIELPESLVERETLAVARRLLSAYPGAGASPEAAETLKTEARRQAEQNIKSHLILEKLAREEGLEVTDAEIEAEVRIMSQANHLDVERLLATLRREGKEEEIRENLLFRKAIDFLVRNVIMK